ncbi:MAG TPA: nucleotidyltransferase [Fimbriimonadaceae bacterium]|jgi:hypothetical protein
MGENTQSSLIDWFALVPEEDWNQYAPVFDELTKPNLKFAVGGGLAFSEYAGRLRNTKDVDLFVLPEQHEAVIQVLLQAGWGDYYETLAYDRSWIFRTCKNDLICDIIWTLPNHRTVVDSNWLSKGKEVEIYGRWTRLVGIEYLILAKLYVFQKDRCDWADIFNVLNASASCVDWNLLLKLLKQDQELLASLLIAFHWLAPDKSASIPAFVWDRLGVNLEVQPAIGEGENRPFLLDTRDWFGQNVGGKSCLSGR